MTLTFCTADKPQREWTVKEGSRKRFATKYHVKCVGGFVVQVCQKAFLDVLRI